MYISFIGDEDMSLRNIDTLLESLNDFFDKSFDIDDDSLKSLDYINLDDLENKNIQTLYQMICDDMQIEKISFLDEEIEHDVEEKIRKLLIAENEQFITKTISNRFLLLDFHHNLVYKLLHEINYILANKRYSDQENFFGFTNTVILEFINRYIENIQNLKLFDFYDFPFLSKILVFYCQMSSIVGSRIYDSPILILINLIPTSQNISSKISLVDSFIDIASNYDLNEIISLDGEFKFIFDSLILEQNDNLTSSIIDLIIVCFKIDCLPNEETVNIGMRICPTCYKLELKSR